MILEQIFTVRWLWEIVNELHISEDKVKDLQRQDGKAHIFTVPPEVHRVRLVYSKVHRLILHFFTLWNFEEAGPSLPIGGRVLDLGISKLLKH